MNRIVIVATIFFGIAALLTAALLLKGLAVGQPVSTATPSPSPTVSPLSQLLAESPRATLPTSQPSPAPLPQQKTLPGGTQVFQTFNNCGPAALSMALSHYGITVSQQQLGQQLRPYQHPRGDNDDKSVTLDEVAAKAREYGLLAYHRPAGDMELVKRFIALDIPVLTRTWLHAGEDIGHFRLIKGYDDDSLQLIQDDSLQGANLRYNYADFLDLWRAFNYEFVVLVPPEKQAEAESILGELLDERQAWQKSLGLAEAALQENPDDLYAGFNKSVALYHLNDYTGSTQAFATIESRLPSRMLWYQLEPVLSYLKLGDTQKVLEIADKILANQNRAYSELYFLKGVISQQQSDQSAAEEAFRLANFYNTTGSWKANLPETW